MVEDLFGKYLVKDPRIGHHSCLIHKCPAQLRVHYSGPLPVTVIHRTKTLAKL